MNLYVFSYRLLFRGIPAQICERAFSAQIDESIDWYTGCEVYMMIFYNINYYKGSYGRPESHISLILDYQFCACVMRTSGVPQLQVIRIECLYGYK